MTDRQLTNLLLGVIAAVLLFGAGAVTGALKWVAIIAVVLLVFYAALTFIVYLAREASNEIQEAKQQGGVELVVAIFGLLAMVFLPVLAGYAFLLWTDGVADPLTVVASSNLGKAWLGLLIIGGAVLAMSFLVSRRHDIIPTLKFMLSLFIRAPLAPFFMTRYGWRKAREAGDGVVSSSATAFLGLLCGLVCWLVIFGAFAQFLGL